MLRRRPNGVLRYALSLALVAAMTLLVGAAVTWVTGGDEDHYGPLFLLPVLAAGALLGRGPAVLASVLSFLAFNWFFVPPVHTLTVADAEDWQGLLTSLAVALVTGELTSRLRARADDANRREHEAIALQEVGQALSAATSFDEGLAATERSLRRVLGDVTLRLILATDSVNKEEPDPAVASFPLTSGGRSLGVLRVTGRGGKLHGEERRLLTSTADQLALALDRAGLQRQMVRTEVQRQTDELRSVMLLSVSHDFRTPLAAIKAAAGSLRAGGASPAADLDTAARDAAAEQVEREADRLNRLVENLLGLSRIEAGALRLDRQWYPLRELVEDTAARLAGILATRRLVVDVPDGLPPVSLDYVLVQQVLANLLDNAIKHTPTGSEIRVAARHQNSPPEVVVRVMDRGPGVPAAERERVFAPFYRLPTTAGTTATAAARAGDPTPARSGSGYGLAVCAGFIAAHGGRIWVEDAPGGGAAFAFSLPLTSPPGPPTPPDTSARAPDRTHPTGPAPQVIRRSRRVQPAEAEHAP